MVTMVTMYDKHGKPHQLVAPEREKPQLGQLIYIHGDKAATTWLASGWQEYLLHQRLIFLTAEDARAMTVFQFTQRMGL